MKCFIILLIACFVSVLFISTAEAVSFNGRYITIGSSALALPQSFRLQQNYPNPFNNRTVITYTLPVSSTVTIDIVDISGRVIVTLLDDRRKAGRHSVGWDGYNQSGLSMSSGLYIYRIIAMSEDGNIHRTSQKMLLIK